MREKEVREKIEEIYNEDRKASLKDLGAVKYVGINDEKDTVILIIAVSEKGSKEEDSLKRKIAKVVKLDLGFSGVRIQFEEEKMMKKAAGNNTKFIFITSNKGGTGKSTITLNLAYSLKNAGKRVGILDADIYNASIAKMMEITEERLNVDENNKIIPLKHDDIEIISTDFFSEDEEALMWRGDMLSSMISNYIFQVAWDKKMDYILVDMPPGTGDVLLDIAENIPQGEAIIVSNEDNISAYQSLKTYKALKELKINVIGFVLNRCKGNDFAKKYLTLKCPDSEVIASIKETSLDKNFRILGSEESVIDDIASLILIR